MKLLFIMLSMCSASEISIFDSKTNPKISYVMVDDCLAPIPKNKIKNTCEVMKMVNKFCNLNLELEKCRDQ